jgi:hypothetical protein
MSDMSFDITLSEIPMWRISIFCVTSFCVVFRTAYTIVAHTVGIVYVLHTCTPSLFNLLYVRIVGSIIGSTFNTIHIRLIAYSISVFLFGILIPSSRDIVLIFLFIVRRAILRNPLMTRIGIYSLFATNARKIEATYTVSVHSVLTLDGFIAQ